MSDRNGVVLKAGQNVLIHPTKTSKSRKPYKATVTQEVIAWTTGDKLELCTYVEGGHTAVINDYLESRIEVI